MNPLLDRIRIDPNVCFGKPTIRGTRLWVSLILDQLASGATTDELIADYPQLTLRIFALRWPMAPKPRGNGSFRFRLNAWREVQAGRKHRPQSEQLLRDAGHDVSTVTSQSLNGTADENLFEVCIAEQRALVSLDHDFGQVLRFPPGRSAGIVILEVAPRAGAGAVESRMHDLIALLSEYEWERNSGSSSPAGFESTRIRTYRFGP